MANGKKKNPIKLEEETQQDFYVGTLERANTHGITEEKIHERLGDIHKNKVKRLTDKEKEIINRWNEWGLKDVPQNWKELLAGKPSPIPSEGLTTTTTPTISADKVLEAFIHLLLDPPKSTDDYSDNYSKFTAFVSKLSVEEKKKIVEYFHRSNKNLVWLQGNREISLFPFHPK
jgi:hypothetical protein